MKTDLQLLIEHLEAEKQSLELNMQDALAEQDYMAAYHSQNAIWYNDFHLNVLLRMADPAFDLKQELVWKQKISARFDNNYPDFPNYMKREIESAQEKINNIILRPQLPFNDSQDFDDALFELKEGKLKSFDWILSKRHKFLLQFNIDSATNLIITIPVTEDEVSEIYPISLYSPGFHKLGFHYSPDGYFSYIINIKNLKEATPIKIFLSRMIYEVLRTSLLDTPSELVLHS